MNLWRFILVNSNDMSNIGELTQAKNWSLALKLNTPGSFNFKYAMDAPHATEIEPYATGIKARRLNRRKSITMSKPVWDTIWSGHILNIDEDISGKSMTVSVVGWLQRLERRHLRRKKNYVYDLAANTTDDGDIILDILNEMNLVAQPDGYTARIPTGSDPNTPTWLAAGSKLPNEGPGGATAYTPAYRGRQYEVWQQALSAIQEMTQLENGCDIELDPETRELNIYRKKMRVLDNVIFGHMWGPKNIAQLGRQIDGSTVINYAVATGTPLVASQYADDLVPADNSHPSQDKIGLLEEVFSLSDVGDANVLRVYAGEEVLLRQNPKVVYTMQPFPYIFAGRVYEPFVDYAIGDRVFFTARGTPRTNINRQGIRVFGLTVSPDNEGNEKISNFELSP